jgi:hypothetical protein
MIVPLTPVSAPRAALLAGGVRVVGVKVFHAAVSLARRQSRTKIDQREESQDGYNHHNHEKSVAPPSQPDLLDTANPTLGVDLPGLAL